jgi:DNA polymerase III alpha subunit
MIRNHSHFSLLRGYGTPEQIVSKAKELGYNYCGLTDYKSISGCIDFYEECVKQEIKPVLGCDFGKFSLLAKNKEGWNELIYILSVDDPDFSYSENLIRLNHVIGSHDTRDITVLGVNTEGDSIWCPPSYYINTEDAEIHRILISIKVNKSVPDIKKDLDENPSSEYKEFSTFFSPHKDHSIKPVHADVDHIADLVEEFNILSKPRLPKFECPGDQSEIEYLRELCREGWKEKKKKKNGEMKN